MRWLLDTNACIRYLNGRAPSLSTRLRGIRASDVVLCSVVKAELLYGAARSQDPAKTRRELDAFLSPFVSLPFDDAAAEVYGRIRADLATRGVPIGPNDLLIAAIAIANSVTLVSHNTAEFSRVGGLDLEDWEQPEAP